MNAAFRILLFLAASSSAAALSFIFIKTQPAPVVITEMDFDEPVGATLFGDVDGDGNKDAVLLLGRRVEVHRYQSDGTFSRKTNITVKLPGDAVAVDLCILDSPGSTGAIRKSKLLVACARGIFQRSLEKDDAAFTQINIPYLTDSLVPRAAGADPIAMTLQGDFNNDGIPELMIPLGEGVAILKNTENGWKKIGIAKANVEVDLALGENRPGASLKIHFELPRIATVDVVHSNNKKERLLSISRDADAWVYRVTDDSLILIEHVRGLYRFDSEDNLRDFRGTRRNEETNDRPVGLVAVDLNADAIPDFIASRFRDGQVFIILGKEGEFTADVPNRVIDVDGWAVLAQARDVTGDGRPELIVPRLPKLGIAGALKALLSRKVTFELWVYKNIAAPGIVSDSPDWKRSFDLEILIGGDEGKISVNARLLAGTYNLDGGDGMEFIALTAPDKLGVFGNDTNSVFTSDPVWEFTIPSVEDWSEADMRGTDMNGDGRDDLTIVYGSNKRGSKNKLLFIVSKK
ncbi:MAG: FG-GAP repeat domain-containing protein [Planctomycetota bacterium]